jgi:hypothetical protein
MAIRLQKMLPIPRLNVLEMIEAYVIDDTGGDVQGQQDKNMWPVK